MISLNEVTLSDDILWINKYSEPSAILSAQRSISGNSIIQTAQFNGGITITVGSVSIDTGYSGWFTKLQVEAFKALETSGQIVTFIYESYQFQVIVVPGSINMEPLIPRPNSVDTDNFVGSISLITI
jgi:hypothetical protein